MLPAVFPQPSSGSGSGSGSGFPDLLGPYGSPFSGEVRFLPLRQVLDGRVKRRIRRNGLSEEMNAISAERRRRARETKAEIERLKAELAAKDAEIAKLHDETAVLDTDRVWNLEQQVAALKKELASRSGVQEAPSSPGHHDWADASPASSAGDVTDVEDENDDADFGEAAAMAELACSTPSRRMRTSFPTPPATSPPLPEVQSSARRLALPQLDTGTQASLADPEKRRLQDELGSLRLEVSKLTTTLESYSTLTTRLSDKLATFAIPTPSEEKPCEPPTDVETQLNAVLQTLSDRTAALTELNSSLKDLGFPGRDAFEVIDSLRSSFRAARLELEYLNPGELTLPLTSAGAEVLDLVLARLRDLAKKNREAEDCIDEYHTVELSLREQLSARVDAMDGLAKQLDDAERQAREKDARIADLEAGLDRLKGAAELYRRDIAELEALVRRMESDLEQKTAAAADLEARLAAALDRSASLDAELAAVRAAHRESREQLVAEHRAALADRDARIDALRAELEPTTAMLRDARDALARLRAENARLAGEKGDVARRADAERARARRVVEGMRAELERVMRMGREFVEELEGPSSLLESGGQAASEGCGGGDDGGGGGSGARTRDAGDDAGVGSDATADAGASAAGAGADAVAGTKHAGDVLVREGKRRRYDSGVGLVEDESIDGESDA